MEQSTPGTPLAVGRVLAVNVSVGGVPKHPIDGAWVHRFGVEGDTQRGVTGHGGPHRAVCLLGIETIERLQSEGHPIEPGSTGENLTTTGIEWSLLPVGARALIGEELELELASPANPCKNLVDSFIGGRFAGLSIAEHPSDSRMYARVLREGEVRGGDEIRILPPAPDSRAQQELLLKRLDRAEAKSMVAAWRAAAEAGFKVAIVEDADLMMAASPDLPGPAYNHAAGLARMPQLVRMATAFYERHRLPGWLIAEEEPWPNAEVNVVVGVYSADPAAIADAPPPEGVTIRPLRPGEGGTVERLYLESGSVPERKPGAPNPWPPVYAALAGHPHRVVLIAESGGTPVGIASLHTHGGVGWMRGAAVLPAARGKGIQQALIAARARLAIERGCDIVGSWAEPDETSGRNMDRMGMSRIGTRTHYVYVPAGVEPPPE